MNGFLQLSREAEVEKSKNKNPEIFFHVSFLKRVVQARHKVRQQKRLKNKGCNEANSLHPHQTPLTEVCYFSEASFTFPSTISASAAFCLSKVFCGILTTKRIFSSNSFPPIMTCF